MSLSSLLAIGCGAPNTPEMPALEASAAKPAIFDHDGCIDDYVALLMLLASEKYNLQAVTVAYGDGYREPSAARISHHLTAKARDRRATTSLPSIASARRTVKYASARRPSPASY